MKAQKILTKNDCKRKQHVNSLNQNDLEQVQAIICNVLNGINNTYDRKKIKGRAKLALFCSYCSSHGLTKGRYFIKPRK